MSQKKDVHKAICKNNTEDIKYRYHKKTDKVALKAIRNRADEWLTENKIVQMECFDW